MASSHHLMTVCMFCLLCATHSTCSAHDGVLPNSQYLRTLDDLKHEKFKTKNLIVDSVNDEKLQIQEMPKTPVSQIYDSVEVNNQNKDSLSDIGRNLIGFRKEYWERKLALKLKHNSRKHGNKNWRNSLTVSKNDMSDDAKNEYRRYVKLHGDGVELHRENTNIPYEPIHHTSLHHSDVDPGAAHIEIKRTKEDFSRLSNDNDYKKIQRTKREITSSESGTTPQSVEYKTNLKNIDVDFYIKKLFIQFGNRDTMTMDLEGFDRMLKKLDLDRMVVEAGKIENGTSVQKPPVEAVINGVRSNSTNVNCVNSVDLISSLKLQSKAHHSHLHEDTPRNESLHNVSSSQTLGDLKSSILLNTQILTKICPILLYQKVSDTSYERQGCLVEREFARANNVDDEHEHHQEYAGEGSSNRTAVWVYSSLCILFISLCGLLGIVVIPIMEHAYYQQILQFLVALAVGTLSGDALLHLLPHALSPDSHDHGHGKSVAEIHSHNDSMWKGLVAMIGVVFFYFTEKFLNLITEWRKRKMREDKENKLPSRVRVMRNDIGCLKGSGSCSSHTGKDGFLKIPALSMFKPNSENKDSESNSVPSSGKICKHKYSEYPYCYDEITTDTLDDHHHRGMTKNSSNEKVANKKNIPGKAGEESSLSVVSLNVLNDRSEHSTPEPGVNDALLANDTVKSNNAKVGNNSTQKKYDFPISMGFELDNTKKIETSNGGKRRVGVKIADGHVRSRSADRAGELEGIDIHKGAVNQKESYTVILREHSQNHHGHSHSHGHVHSPPSSLSSVVWMVIMGDGLHNFTDGMAIGAAFSSNIAGGFSTAIAVLCHELPHEIGDFAVLLKAGMSAKRAVCYNLLSSILCLFGMMVGVCAGHTPEATAWIFAAAAGMFLYIALVDMIPELSSSHSNEGSFCQCLLQLSGLTVGIGIMLIIAMYEDHLKALFG